MLLAIPFSLEAVGVDAMLTSSFMTLVARACDSVRLPAASPELSV